MAIIRKKTWPKLFEAIERGDKTFDLRLNDFDVKEGDTLIFEEWDPETKDYTGREVSKVAGYVMAFDPKDPVFWERDQINEKGIVIISLKK